ncbi:putative membrane-associated kinase regulator 4 [Acorus calamus]|uniref:Membrane-associated kinase regulator 4 n=1 Tax=Acorus calamus TaxID=4465 RepID=A0AAV9DDJ9_ACOCL|nr:putative membrane-associated kinase regulator 4 [Acorus calamus]
MIPPSPPYFIPNITIREREREIEREMAKDLISSATCDQIEEEEEEEGYIDMDITSTTTTTILCYTITTPPKSNEFEFHLSNNPVDTQPTTSPADELFYKGKLLPLHLPPRIQMVENLLQFSENNACQEAMNSPFQANHASTTNSTPFESCNVSPAGSCYVSGELNPEEYFYECFTSDDTVLAQRTKKSWSKKLKLIRQSSLGLKLKASKAYFVSLFSKSGCSDKSCSDAAKKGELAKVRERLNSCVKVNNKNPLGQIRRDGKEKIGEEDECHRRSFSRINMRHSETNCLSSSSSSCSSSTTSLSSSSSFSSLNSNGLSGPHVLKRCGSYSSEVESSIKGAIAHCKQSQQLDCDRKSVSDVGLCSVYKERPGLCRG